MARTFELADARNVVGSLVSVLGGHAGTRLRLRRGVTFIGRQRGLCEYLDRDSLAGVVEAAQVYVRVDGRRVFVTDATSTNPCALVRRAHAGPFLEGARTAASLAQAPPVDEAGIVPVAHEPFGRPRDERRWVEVHPGDLLLHVYGGWVIELEADRISDGAPR